MKLFTGTIEESFISIDPEEQSHILKVLRLKNGDAIAITDGLGNIAHGSLSIEGKKALLMNAKIERNLPPFPIRLHIAIAPTKNIDRIEFFIEKAVEMGISEISILQTEKTERKIINIEKLRKQAIAACKQSLRTHFPIINDSTKLPDFIKKMDPTSTFVAHCDENFERISINFKFPIKSITYLVGPEGDFSPKEIRALADKGVRAISLGNQRLRTETAGIFLAAKTYQEMLLSNT